MLRHSTESHHPHPADCDQPHAPHPSAYPHPAHHRPHPDYDHQQQPHAAAYHHQPAHHDGHGRLHHASHDRSCACPHPFASPFVSEAATFVSGGGADRRLLDEPAGFPPLAQLPSDGIHGIRPAEIREISAEMGIEVEAAPDDTDEGTF